jgi:hypothetical protein
MVGEWLNYGEIPARPACGAGPESEGITCALIRVIWQPHHKGLSASYWQLGTSVADDARRLDYAKSLRGVKIRIPGSDSVRLPRMSGEARLSLRGSYEQSRRYYRGSSGVSQKWTDLPRTTRNAVLCATLFVARSGLTVFDTAWLHWKPGRGLA